MIHTLPAFLLNPTHNIKIILIGCGGTGSLMLSRLARIDYALRQSNKVGLDVTVYDDDIVEDYNIGRQMFSLSDVGENKAITIVSKINRNFLTNFKAIPKKFDFSTNKEDNGNIYITAVDNAAFRVEFNKFFKKQNAEENVFYWMDLGNGKDNAQCIIGSTQIEQTTKEGLVCLPTIVDRYPHLISFDTEEIQGLGCNVGYMEKLNEQNLFINDTLTAFASNLLWEMLTVGFISKFGFFLNNKNLICNPILT